jgi:hypothetical protein
MAATQDNDNLSFEPIKSNQSIDDESDEGGFLSKILSGEFVLPLIIKPDIKYSNTTCNQQHLELYWEYDKDNPPPWELPPSEYCGFPLAESTRGLLARCVLLKVTDFPVSFACSSPTVHISKEKLFKCPCFQAEFFPYFVLEDTCRALEDERCSMEDVWWNAKFYDHLHDQCESCKHQHKVPAESHQLLRELPTSLPEVPNGMLLNSIMQDNLQIQKCSVGLGNPTTPRKHAETGFPPMAPTLTLLRPLEPIHLGHNRFFDERCSKGCPSPIDASPVLRGIHPADHITLYGHSIPPPSTTCKSNGTIIPVVHIIRDGKDGRNYRGPGVQRPGPPVTNSSPVESYLPYLFYVFPAILLFYWVFFGW